MRPIGIKLKSIIGLVVTLSLFLGCSGADLLDEETARYHGTASSEDNGALTPNIDVVQDGDCDNDNTTIDPEPFTAFNVQVVIESDSTAVEFTVERYTVNIRPNHGANGGAQVTRAQMPTLVGTTLNPISANTSVLVKPGSSVTKELPVWNVGDKTVYGSLLVSAGFGNVAATNFVYDIQVVLNCRSDEDDTFTITTPWTPVDFGNYNNC